MPIRPQIQGKGTVSLSFAANLRYVRPIRHFVSALCALAKYSEDETESIALVTTEILNNSIEHGAKGPDDEIGMTMTVTSERFRCEVVDPGKGGDVFAKAAISRAGRMPDLEEPRGRGLFLIKSYMDEMTVTWDPKNGTRLVVSKAITP
jgi:anti-sigma regulatory factor (Ser/Thr protein kinase)